MQNMLRFFSTLETRTSFWWLILLGGIALEAVALFYQHYLLYPPCVFCIHIRLWIMALVLISACALLLREFKPTAFIAGIANVLVGSILVERSWQTLGVERGWSFGSCSMESGIPAWMPLDQWLPFLFEVQMPCGYTPQIVFKITMAEVLMVGSAAFLLVSILMIATRFTHRR